MENRVSRIVSGCSVIQQRKETDAVCLLGSSYLIIRLQYYSLNYHSFGGLFAAFFLILKESEKGGRHHLEIY